MAFLSNLYWVPMFIEGGVHEALASTKEEDWWVGVWWCNTSERVVTLITERKGRSDGHLAYMGTKEEWWDRVCGGAI